MPLCETRCRNDRQGHVAESLQHERKQSNMTIHWRFTTEYARIKLKRFYPVIEQES